MHMVIFKLRYFFNQFGFLDLNFYEFHVSNGGVDALDLLIGFFRIKSAKERMLFNIGGFLVEDLISLGKMADFELLLCFDFFPFSSDKGVFLDILKVYMFMSFE